MFSAISVAAVVLLGVLCAVCCAGRTLNSTRVYRIHVDGLHACLLLLSSIALTVAYLTVSFLSQMQSTDCSR